MNHFEQGYRDQLDGTLDVMADETSKAGEAYRAGARTCRADLEAEREWKTLGGEHFFSPDWMRRLSEMRAPDWNPPETAPSNGTPIDLRLDEKTIVTGKREDDMWYAAGRMQGSQTSAIWHKILPPIGWRSLTLAAVPGMTDQKGTSVAITEEKASEIKPASSAATPRSYAEPQPGAKKPKKAKPADDSQGSLFG